MRLRWKSVMFVIFAAAVVAPLSRAAVDENQKKIIREVDRQLACYCGCSLTVADCRVSMTCSESDKLEKEVTEYVKAGLNAKAILAKMREKYGESILAAPTKEGFNITAWTLPFVALLLGGFVAMRYVKRWKREAPATTGSPETTPAHQPAADDYERRVEEELKRFDL